MDDKSKLEELVQDVQANRKYQAIMPELVMKLVEKAHAKGLQGKAAVKDVRSKLHQIGGAYFRRKVDYDEAENDLKDLPQAFKEGQVKQFCIKYMGSHASTAERLPILDSFFYTCLESISPIKSVMDLACGMTPLSLPWMPMDENFNYRACDIYIDMLTFIQSFFDHFKIDGRSSTCNLIGHVPKEKAQVAFILKSIPCLEQVDKEIGLMLLEGVQAEHILVSFPVRSLGGQNKGMPDFYQEHFYEMVLDKSWGIKPFEFATELAFLVTK